MNKLIYRATLVLCVFSLAGCATAIRGTTEDVVINYAPEDATVTTSLNHTCAATPCTVKVSRKQEFSIAASRPGYQSQTVQVNTKFSKGGAAGVAGNVLLGGVIGVGVDAATGATLDHYPNPVTIRLQRDGESAPGVIEAPNIKLKKRTTPTS